MEPRLDSELLRTFLAIAEGGSFTRAAEAVHRTQSAVSMQVKRLEDSIGQPLFRRSGRGVTLTPSGEALLPKARRIVRLLNEAAASLSAEALAGPVSIGVPEEYGSNLLPAILGRFAAVHPGVQVTVRCEPSDGYATAVERGELDLAVVTAEPGDPEDGVLLHDPIEWVASEAHGAHELDPLPLAMFDRGCWWRHRALEALEEAGRPYRVAYTSASVAGVQAAVSSGLAVAVLGRSTLPPGVRTLGGHEGFPALPVSKLALRRRPGAAPAAVVRMAEAIAQAFETAGART
ncbi:MAG: LysR substrate-binding domain-containing protein [Kiloniellales bacterium]